MGQNVNLTNDIAFRYIFGAKQNTDLLRSFLNAIFVSKGATPLREVEILSPFLEIVQIGEKKSVVDIRATDETGKIYNIEMQVGKEEHYEKRALIYLAKMYAGQLGVGEDYLDAKPCIGIHILDFVLFDDLPDFHNEFKPLLSCKPYRSLSDDLSLHFIELPKIDYSSEDFTFLKKWLYFIENANRKEDPVVKQIRKEVPEIDKAALAHERFLAHHRAQHRIQAQQMWEHDQTSALNSARRKGIAEGEALGLAKAKRELALKLKNKGFKPAEIAKLTGLSVKEVKRL